MTKINEVMPSPSHPRSMIIIWGIKINKFIEIINVITKTVKRLINLSSDIYIVENFSTFAEIKITVVEYTKLVLSIIRVITTGAGIIGRRLHSSSKLKSNFRQSIEGISMRITKVHMV